MESQQLTGSQRRAIVLGVGDIFQDRFLNQPVMRIEADGTLGADPPPTGNADLIVNCAYHLLDRGDLIGAGPAMVQPIRIIDASTMAAVKAGFGLLWPLLVLAIGVAIMVVRRR